MRSAPLKAPSCIIHCVYSAQMKNKHRNEQNATADDVHNIQLRRSIKMTSLAMHYKLPMQLNSFNGSRRDLPPLIDRGVHLCYINVTAMAMGNQQHNKHCIYRIYCLVSISSYPLSLRISDNQTRTDHMPSGHATLP